MAIDSQKKRVAAASTRFWWLRRWQFVEPDGTLDAADRGRLAGAFNAIPLAVELNTLAAPETIHQLTIAPGAVGIELNTLAAPETIHQLSVAHVIELPAIAAPETIHQLTIATGAVGIELNTLAAPETIHQLSVAAGFPLPVLAAPETLYPLTIKRTEPGAHMGIELRVMDLAGNLEALIPRYESTAYEDPLSDVGAGQFTLARSDPFLATTIGQELIGDEEKMISVLLDGTEVGRWLVEDVLETFTDDEVPVYQFSGRGIASMLEWGTVIPTTYNPPTNVIVDTIPFTATPAIAAFKSLFDAADARGATGILTYNFTATLDSSGNPWTDSQDLEMHSGGTLLNHLDDLTTLILGDWHVTPSGVIHVELEHGTDLSGSVRLAVGYTAAELSRQRNRRSVRNAYYLAGREGLISATTDATSITNFSRREAYIEAGEAMSSATRDGYLAAAVELGRNPQTSWEVELADPTASGQLPWTDFDLGDTIGLYSAEDGVNTSARIKSIAIAEDSNSGFKCQLVVGDRFETRARKLQRAMQNLSGFEDLVDPSIQHPVPVTLEDTIGELDPGQIPAGSITETKIANDAISTPKLQANSVTADEILTGTITASEIATGTLTSASGVFGVISADDVTTGTLNAATVTVTNIDATNINTGTLDASGITVTNLDATSITTGNLSGVSIDIGGTDTTSLHVDSAGNMWWGNAGSYSLATGKRISNQGVIDFNSGTFAGSLSAATGSFAGSLSAATGTFSGTVSGGSININSGVFVVSAAGAVTITSGSLNINSGVFQVTSAGAITATDATLTGTIKTAASGSRIEMGTSGGNVIDFYFSTTKVGEISTGADSLTISDDANGGGLSWSNTGLLFRGNGLGVEFREIATTTTLAIWVDGSALTPYDDAEASIYMDTVDDSLTLHAITNVNLDHGTSGVINLQRAKTTEGTITVGATNITIASSTGNTLTLDAATSLILDGATSVIFKDAGTTYLTATNPSGSNTTLAGASNVTVTGTDITLDASSDVIMDGASTIQFKAAGTEFARLAPISGAGQLNLFSGHSTEGGQVKLDHGTSGTLEFHMDNNGGEGRFLGGTGGGTLLFKMDLNSTVYAKQVTVSTRTLLINSSGVIGNSTSSLRKKQDIELLSATTLGEAFDSIYPISFEYTPEVAPDAIGQRFDGFAAENVVEFFPNAVPLDELGRPDGVEDRHLVPVLWVMVQDLRRRLASAGL